MVWYNNNQQEKDENKMSTEFSISKPRPLPVILLADISGSMSEDGKIDALNTAVNEMIRSFAEEEEDALAEIQVAVITFGKGGAKLHSPLRSASEIEWEPMKAEGTTPLAAALDIATDMLEDKSREHYYYPVLILVSDGQPTNEKGYRSDNWKKPLQRLLKSERGSKGDRFAMGIGDDADLNVLNEFLADTEAQLFQTNEARQIRDFFRWVTIQSLKRSQIDPNSRVKVDPEEINEFLRKH